MSTSKNVIIRARTPADIQREALWRADPELRVLNPIAGKYVGVQIYSIEAIPEGKHIGACSLYNFIGHDSELGIAISYKNYWDKGYGTEIVRTLTAHCFDTTNVERIWLKVLPNNARAVRCYEKAGFTRCGKLSLDGYEFVTMEIRK